MQSKGANGWQPEKWSYLKRSRTVINEIIALGTLIHVHALGGDLSSPFDLCVSACIQYVSACLCVFASNQPLSLIFFLPPPLPQSFSFRANSKGFIILSDLLLTRHYSWEYGTGKEREEHKNSINRRITKEDKEGEKLKTLKSQNVIWLGHWTTTV